MKELIRKFAYGDDLFVYPFIADDVPDEEVGLQAHVEATRYPVPAVHCNVYFERSSPLTREEWKQLYAAIERGWGWLSGEQP